MDKWYNEHKEMRLKAMREYYLKHRDEILAKRRQKYSEGHPSYVSSTKFMSPEEKLAYNARRRERYASDKEYREKAKARSSAYLKTESGKIANRKHVAKYAALHRKSFVSFVDN